MNNKIKLGLLISVFVVLTIGFTLSLVLKIKAKKLKKNIFKKNIEENKKILNSHKVEGVPNLNELVWELKENFKNPINNISLEYILVTALRNNYKNIWMQGYSEGYEILTLAIKTNAVIHALESSIKDLKKFQEMATKFKIPKTKIKLHKKKNIKDKFDFVILSKTTKDFNKSFDDIWFNVDKGGMLIIAVSKKLNQSQKQLIQYLKLIGARYDHIKNLESFIIVAK